MGVPCPGCGRSYDVALFQFGRSLDCHCGTRVGLEPRVQLLPGKAETRFIADAMLGRLARWLRILGYDTAYLQHIPDEDLVRRALAEQRTILTRDRSLESEWWVTGIHCVAAEEPLAQLAEVTVKFGLDPRARLFTRCSRCNHLLVAVDRSEAARHVPTRTLETAERFQRCPGCGRFYWEGSHTARMQHVLERTLGRPAAGTGR